jgi:hypothetical protein
LQIAFGIALKEKHPPTQGRFAHSRESQLVAKIESFDYGGGFVTGAVGWVGVVAGWNGVVIKGVSAVVLLANPMLGHRSKLAVNVKYTTLALTTPACRMSGAERAAELLLSVHR